MLTKEHFFKEIGEADKDLKTDLYKRFKKIEEAFIEGKIAASKSNTSYGYQSIGVFLEGISLNAPCQIILNDKEEIIGIISLPNNLKDFLQIFCSGSTHAAFYLLKRAKFTIQNSGDQSFSGLITDLQPKTYFIDVIDRLYTFYIGGNPKYARNAPIKASDKQLDASNVVVNSDISDEETVINSFLQSFQTIFNMRPNNFIKSYISEGFCQVCHRPHIPHKKYCHNHAYDTITRNSPAKKELRWAVKSFRNLGLLLNDEVFFASKKPNSYIQEAKKHRMELGKGKDKHKSVESKVLFEYCLGLQGWAKHNPLYKNFKKSFYLLLDEYDNILSLKNWNNQDCHNLASNVIKLCKKTRYFPNEMLPSDLKHIFPASIKPILLGPTYLDIKSNLHFMVTIKDWALMLLRCYNLELIYMCRKKDKAELLRYPDQ